MKKQKSPVGDDHRADFSKKQGNNAEYHQSSAPPKPKTTSLLQAALQYTRKGFPVFPVHGVVDGHCTCQNTDCDQIGKHPRTAHGFKDATNDQRQILEWWRKWPTANIGMPTGRASGLFVLDVDPRHGGHKSLRRLLEHGPVPHTPEQWSGGGGKHIFLKYSGEPLPKALAPGIDIKAEGGYVILAPSVHKSGKRYRWEIPL